jgi:hypothetical protein
VNYAYGPKHAVAHLYDRNGGTATSDRIYGNVVDARGRQWYVADGALVVESLLGGDRSVYPIGSLPALVKAGNAANGMLVVGGGPSTLPAAGTVATVETVTGKIMFGSTPLANAEVELCTSPSFNYQVSPCAGAASRVATTTNAKGELTFTKVPLGLYSLTFKNGPKWGRASDVSVALVKAAPTHALGTLRY